MKQQVIENFIKGANFVITKLNWKGQTTDWLKNIAGFGGLRILLNSLFACFLLLFLVTSFAYWNGNSVNIPPRRNPMSYLDGWFGSQEHV